MNKSTKVQAAEEEVCDEIQSIVQTYREQQATGYVDTPGGLEHMDDVWSLLFRWDKTLNDAAEEIPE